MPDSPSLRTLYERKLVREGTRIVRKGLSRVYNERDEPLSAVRGRILVRENLGVPKGTLVCRYAVLSYDTPENRILKHALGRQIDAELSRPILRHLNDVPSIDGRLNFRLKFSRLNRHYKKAIDASRLLTVGVPKHIQLTRSDPEI